MKFFLHAMGGICLLLLPFTLRAGDYEKAWEAIFNNDKQRARELLLKSVKSNVNRDNAIASLIMLETYEGIGENYLQTYPNPLEQFVRPEPYVYALWFNNAILGTYGRKEGKQLANIERLADDTAYNGSLRAAANYFKGFHLFFCRQPEKAAALYPKMGALKNWQFVGPFDNISGSGFNKDYGPLKDPKAGKGFVSYNNAAIDWFTPLHTNMDGWVFVGPLLPAANAVGYAQTYVLSDKEQDALLCLGNNGSLKIWLNDKLMWADPEEHVTELDAYKVRCHLNKGYNRILVQIGFTDGNTIPNFIVRLTDERYNALPGLTSTGEPQDYKKDTTTNTPQTVIHFAEDYFRRQMQKYPQDPAYAFMLAKVYIRNEQYDKAKAVMIGLYKKYPNSLLVLNQYVDSHSSVDSRSEVTEIVEKMKSLDPENYWFLQAKATKMEEEKRYAEELELINRMVSLRGENSTTMLKKVGVYAYMEKLDSTVQLLKDAYARYPGREDVVTVMYQFYKSVMKDPSAALQVLEKYTADTYSSELLKAQANEYFEQNQAEKGEALLRNYIAGSPNEVEVYSPLAVHYFSRQRYDSAVYYMQQAHQVSPYNHRVLGDIANCYLQMNNKPKALEYYKKALSLYTGGYSYRQKIRELENKPDVFKYFPALDHYAQINKALKQPADTSQAFYFILDEKNVVIYGEGGFEQSVSTAVYINNKEGIDSWKQASVPYNNTYQDVTIIKAEVVKPDGARVPAEIYGNEIVFTRLEEGDAIYYNYKMNSFAIGRLGREYWDKFYFTASVPTAIARYNILVADQLPIYYEFRNNNTVKPVESRHENFRLYAWEMKDVPAYKRESYMPGVNDVGQVLHVSTVKSWDVIAEWYSDLTRMQCREDFTVNAAFTEIFPQGAAGLNDWEKARRIYEYIEKNIAYSSVSFRQSAYVPQRASKTLSTHLGDCKDLSALFVALAHKAGLEANLTLVSTRDYGQYNLLLPSMDFNHCVARFKADNDYHYLELTNNKLPFNTLPQTLVAAQILNIPFNYNSSEKIALLPADDSRKVSRARKTKVMIKDSDLHIVTNVSSSGELAGIIRSKYAEKNRNELTDALQSSLAQQFRNPVVLDNFTFTNIDNLQDTVTQEQRYTVKNNVINVGDFSMIRPLFLDEVATVDIFTAEARQNPFEYWTYENTDQYLTDIDMELPEGKSFDQVPSNVETSFNNMSYQLTFRKIAPNKLQIHRSFSTNRNLNITAADFNKMKDFFNAIVSAEQKFISFK